MHKITLHHDGHGLNESIKISAIDEPDQNGVCHQYRMSIGKEEVGRIAYQYGSKGKPIYSPGITDSCLLVIVADRLTSIQNSSLNCKEYEEALEHVMKAIDWIKTKTDEQNKSRKSNPKKSRINK